MIVYDENGQRLTLDPQGKSGGEGTIYRITNKNDECVKIYHDHVLLNRGVTLQEKIHAMLQRPPIENSVHKSIAWPTRIIYKDPKRKHFIGFAMPFVPPGFKESIDFYHPQERAKIPGFNFKYLMNSARNLACAVYAIHVQGHRVGDLREKNILVNSNSLIVLVDCDSFQIAGNNKTYYCTVGTGDFLAPELQGCNFSTQQVDRYYGDLFALAILIFKFLMDGFHPYQGVGSVYNNLPTTEAKIKRGIFAYSGKDPNAKPPPRAPDYKTIIPISLQRLFERCFEQGHSNPQERPAAIEWIDALDYEIKRLKQCQKNPLHEYSGDLNSCPYCNQPISIPTQQALQSPTYIPPPQQSLPNPTTPQVSGHYSTQISAPQHSKPQSYQQGGVNVKGGFLKKLKNNMLMFGTYLFLIIFLYVFFVDKPQQQDGGKDSRKQQIDEKIDKITKKEEKTDNLYSNKNFLTTPELYKKACDDGDGAGCFNLGMMYYKGDGVEQNFVMAAELYKKSCVRGYASGCGALGKLYHSGKGVEQNPVLAAEFYKKACNGGYLRGCSDLGMLYLNGDGVEKNLVLAAELFRRACAGNIAEGCGVLGMMYFTGGGVEQNLAKAAELFEKACDGGFADGCFGLGAMYGSGLSVERNPYKSAELLKKACDGGHPHACTLVGSFYENGDGVELNLAMAAEYYKKACEGGDLQGCTNLGVMYYQGEGVEKNFAKAAEYYKIACDGGDALGCNNLGLMYYRGEGVQRNHRKAIELYKKACDGNNHLACNNLGLSYEKGEGVTQNHARAAEYYKKACDMDYDSGCYNLGVLYQDGRGVAQNYAKAAEYYKKACDGGNVSGCLNLGKLYYSGTGVAQNFNQAAELFTRVCNAGNETGCAILGIMYYKGEGVSQNYAKAAELYRDACYGRDNNFCNILGSFLNSQRRDNLVREEKTNTGDIDRLNKKDSQLMNLSKLCDGGDYRACFELGSKYEEGKEVAPDYSKAVFYYEKACEGDNAKACLKIAYVNDRLGNYSKAAELYKKACHYNEGEACYNMGVMYSKGEGVRQNHDLAAEFFKKACDLREAQGCYNLGVLHELGAGVEKDFSEAKSLFKKACDLGVEMGCTKLAKLSPVNKPTNRTTQNPKRKQEEKIIEIRLF